MTARIALSLLVLAALGVIACAAQDDTFKGIGTSPSYDDEQEEVYLLAGADGGPDGAAE